nr:MAG TPA: hypothetical protein [Caudoviricetes sp.]
MYILRQYINCTKAHSIFCEISHLDILAQYMLS